MENDKFIHKNIKDYILYVSDVKNLSKNTSLSYERDLKKFAAFINSLNISQYNQIDDEVCSAWIGDLYTSGNNPRSIQRHLSTLKSFLKLSLTLFITFLFELDSSIFKVKSFDLLNKSSLIEAVSI